MHIKIRHFPKEHLQLFFRLFCISLCWIVFLIIGAYAATLALGNYIPLMLTRTQTRMSIIYLALTAILPFIISAIALRYTPWFFILPIVIFEAYSFGFVGSLIFLNFQGAGWMMRWLLLFTSSVLVVMHLHFWFTNAINSSQNTLYSMTTYVIWFLLLVILDYFCVYKFAIVQFNRLF